MNARAVLRGGIGFLLAGLVLPALADTPAVVEPPPNETAAPDLHVKAAFLYNFAKFTTWPTNALPAAPGPLLIGVWGADPFGPLLDKTVAGKKVEGHSITVKRCATMAEARACPLLFISAVEAARLDELLRELAGAPVVTVSDLENFAARGGMIELAKENGRIVFKINQGAAERVKVSFSSKLLKLARQIVRTPTGGEGTH